MKRKRVENFAKSHKNPRQNWFSSSIRRKSVSDCGYSIDIVNAESSFNIHELHGKCSGNTDIHAPRHNLETPHSGVCVCECVLGQLTLLLFHFQMHMWAYHLSALIISFSPLAQVSPAALFVRDEHAEGSLSVDDATCSV